MKLTIGKIATVASVSVASAFALLFCVLLLRTLTLNAAAEHDDPCTADDNDFIECDSSMIDRFLQALRYETVSFAQNQQNYTELLKLQKHIKTAFPTVHSSSAVKWEVVADYSLLYTVAGADPTLTPYLLSAHLDVVPADPTVWDVPPFDGRVVDDFIYGRGTIDHKQGVFGILEALEFALKRGHRFRRPFYIAIGHDEEVQGMNGARAISRLLASRGVTLEFLLDEGTPIVNDLLPGLHVPLALIGTTEKGFLTVRISANSTGGHSSMPEKESCIGILGAAISRLEANPQPSQFGNGPARAMLEHAAHKMDFLVRVVMSNIWLFAPLIARKFSQSPPQNAMIRTTTAITEFHAGVKSNVIAPNAYAIINHRVHPAQTMEEAIAFDKKVINDDRIKYEVLVSKRPAPMSPYDQQSFGYQTVRHSIRQIWGDRNVIVTPAIMVGNTDSTHYLDMTQNVYRFSPTFMYPIDIPRFHGVNERISVKNYGETVNFFYHVMINADKATLEPLHKHGEEF